MTLLITKSRRFDKCIKNSIGYKRSHL